MNNAILRSVIKLAMPTVLWGCVPIHSSALAQSETEPVKGLGKWWYHKFSEAVPQPQLEFIERRRKLMLDMLMQIPEELRAPVGYILRLNMLKRGGPPIGTPLNWISLYCGVGLREEELSWAIIRASRNEPEFLGPDILRKAMRLNVSFAGLISPALSAMGEFSNEDLKWCLAQKDDQGEMLPVARWIMAGAEKGLLHRKRLEYGVTWGPVGRNAAEFAMAELTGSNGHKQLDTTDDRWVKCVEVVNLWRPHGALDVLYEFSGCRVEGEPTNNSYETDTLNKYPAAAAVIQFGDGFLDFIEKKIACLTPGEVRQELTSAIKYVVAIKAPRGCLKWLYDLEKKYLKTVETGERHESAGLINIRKMKDSLKELKDVPKYYEQQPFSGSVSFEADW